MRSKKEIEEAVKQLRMLNADDEVRELAEAQERAELDRNTELYIAKEDGRAEGMAAGRAEGMAAGREAGKKEAQKENAKKMLDKGMDIKLIMEITGLTKEEMDKLL